MQKKKFHLREILAITTGLSLGGKYFAGLQEIHDFLEEGSMRSKANNLLKQFPQLADCGKDFTAKELTTLKAGTDKAEIESVLERWINRQIAKYGEYFEVSSSLASIKPRPHPDDPEDPYNDFDGEFGCR